MNINAWFRRRRKDKSNRWWYWSGWSSWLGNSIGLDIDLKAYWSGLNKVSCLRRGCRCRRRSSSESEQQIILLAKKKDRYLLTLSPLWELPNSYWLRWFIDWNTSSFVSRWLPLPNDLFPFSGRLSIRCWTKINARPRPSEHLGCPKVREWVPPLV